MQEALDRVPPPSPARFPALAIRPFSPACASGRLLHSFHIVGGTLCTSEIMCDIVRSCATLLQAMVGRTVLVVAHRLSTVRNATKVLTRRTS